MKHYAFTCALLFSFSAAQICAAPEPTVQMKKNKAQHKALLQQICSSYVASLALSGCIGATTGTVVRYLEKQLNIESSPISLFLMLLGWALESEFRNDVIIGLQKDLDAYQIEYKKGLMFKGAWIASWLAYLHAQ